MSSSSSSSSPSFIPGTQGLYAVRDLVSDSFFGGIHLFRADAAAVRMFGDVVAMDGSAVGAHPDDYVLVRLGVLDDATGAITSHYEVVVTGTAIVAARTPTSEVNS